MIMREMQGKLGGLQGKAEGEQGLHVHHSAGDAQSTMIHTKWG